MGVELGWHRGKWRAVPGWCWDCESDSVSVKKM